MDRLAGALWGSSPGLAAVPVWTEVCRDVPRARASLRSHNSTDGGLCAGAWSYRRVAEMGVWSGPSVLEANLPFTGSGIWSMILPFFILFFFPLYADKVKSEKMIVIQLCLTLWVIQLCLTLWDPMWCSPPGSFVHGILQTRILERVAIPFCGTSYDPGIEPGASTLQMDSLLPEPPGKPMVVKYK